jgi:hypothetical protein
MRHTSSAAGVHDSRWRVSNSSSMGMHLLQNSVCRPGVCTMRAHETWSGSDRWSSHPLRPHANFEELALETVRASGNKLSHHKHSMRSCEAQRFKRSLVASPVPNARPSHPKNYSETEACPTVHRRPTMTPQHHLKRSLAPYQRCQPKQRAYPALQLG